jgi:organic radical activating enzyme
MKMFNPVVAGEPAKMSAEARAIASQRMIAHWQNPDFRARQVAHMGSEQVARFINNGKHVHHVSKVLDQKAFVRLYGNMKATHTVHNFEVEDNHTYVANGNVVHNCDTYFDSGDVFSFEQIFEKIDKTVRQFYSSRGLELPRAASEKMLLVITGGEPLLQRNLTAFLAEADRRGYRVQIESNGIIYTRIPDSAHLVVSPKLNESICKFILPHKLNLERADTLKFVISESMPGYTDIPDFALDWYSKYPNRNLYVSPMNTYLKEPVKVGDNGDIDQRSEIDERVSFWTPGLLDPVQNQKNHEYAAYIAMKHGARLSLQTHLYASLP